MKIKEIKNNPEVIFLIGLPGSGKTTYIQSLKSKNKDKHYAVVSSDDILQNIASEEGITYNQSFKKFGRASIGRMLLNAKEYIKNNRNIIWDQTNLTKKGRRNKLALFPNNYIKKAIVFSVPKKELFNRLNKREEQTGKEIPGYVIQNMSKSFQPPTSEEFSSIDYK